MNNQPAPSPEQTAAQTKRDYEQHRTNVANIKTALQLTPDLGARARLWRMLTEEMSACHALITGELAS